MLGACLTLNPLSLRWGVPIQVVRVNLIITNGSDDALCASAACLRRRTPRVPWRAIALCLGLATGRGSEGVPRSRVQGLRRLYRTSMLQQARDVAA